MLVDPEAKAVGIRLPPGSGGDRPGCELDAEDSAPDAAGTPGVIGRELDQWRGPKEYAPALRALLPSRDERHRPPIATRRGPLLADSAGDHWLRSSSSRGWTTAVHAASSFGPGGGRAAGPGGAARRTPR